MSHNLQEHQIVLAAFGTSTASSGLYQNLKQQFEERFNQEIPLGFTSRVGNPKLKRVLEGLPLLKEVTVIVTPLFMITGKVVSDDIEKVVKECKPRFKAIRIAQPLLPDERIYELVLKELSSNLHSAGNKDIGIIFVGHGTPDSNSSYIYTDCARKIASCFPPSVKVAFGNVEMSAPYVKECLGEIIMSGIKTLIVQPFMVVDGVHIHEDMRGALDKQDPANKIYQYLMDTYGEPLRERLSKITVVYKPGLGAYPGVFELFADHTLKAIAGNEHI
jgi:cobalamin biosynthesis Co2+ chelatase CbiK